MISLKKSFKFLCVMLMLFNLIFRYEILFIFFSQDVYLSLGKSSDNRKIYGFVINWEFKNFVEIPKNLVKCYFTKMSKVTVKIILIC